METLHELCRQLSALKKTVELEQFEREERKAMGDYQALSKRIEEAMMEQDRMLALIPDSSHALALLHSEVLARMEEEKIYAVDGVEAVWREKNEVNRERLFRVLEGDVDAMVSISTVTQKALSEFAKNHPQKKEIMACVELKSRSIVDLKILPPLPTNE